MAAEDIWKIRFQNFLSLPFINNIVCPKAAIQNTSTKGLVTPSNPGDFLLPRIAVPMEMLTGVPITPVLQLTWTVSWENENKIIENH